MEVIQKSLKVDKYYETHLDIINPMLPTALTPKERTVLALFMGFKGTMVEEGRFNSLTRKIVMKRMGLSLGGLSNYINSLTGKGYIYKDEEGILHIKNFLFPEEKMQGYMFKLINNGI